MPSFHVLIATIGRPTLKRMLASLRPQLLEKDVLTVVFDGQDRVPVEFEASLNPLLWKATVRVHCEPSALGAWGHGIRNKYTRLLKFDATDFLLHADDDDAYVDGTFDRLRSACQDTQALYIMRYRCSNTITPRIGREYVAHGNIGTPCGVIPRSLALSPVDTLIWGHKLGGDGEYYESLAQEASRLRMPIHFFNWVGYVVRPKNEQALVDTAHQIIGARSTHLERAKRKPREQRNPFGILLSIVFGSMVAFCLFVLAARGMRRLRKA